MTAHAMVGDRDKCLAVGMNDHVSKPIEIKELYASLERWIQPGRQQAGTSEPATPPKKAPSEDEIALPEDLYGVDVASALRRVRGNRAMLKRLILDFAARNGDADTRLRAVLAEEDFEEAVQQVHAIKGVAGNLAATHLHALSETLEHAIRNRGTKEELLALVEPFGEALQKVVTAAERLKPTVLSEEDPVPIDSGYAVDAPLAEGVREDILRLSEMLASNNLKARQVFPALKDALQGRHLERDLAGLEEALLRLNFARASEIVRELMEKLGVSV